MNPMERYKRMRARGEYIIKLTRSPGGCVRRAVHGATSPDGGDVKLIVYQGKNVRVERAPHGMKTRTGMPVDYVEYVR